MPNRPRNSRHLDAIAIGQAQVQHAIRAMLGSDQSLSSRRERPEARKRQA